MRKRPRANNNIENHFVVFFLSFISLFLIIYIFVFPVWNLPSDKAKKMATCRLYRDLCELCCKMSTGWLQLVSTNCNKSANDKLQQANKIDNLQQVCGVFGCIFNTSYEKFDLSTHVLADKTVFWLILMPYLLIL